MRFLSALLALALVAAPPLAMAQTSPVSAPASTAEDLSNLTAQVAALQHALQNQSLLLQSITGLLGAQVATFQGFNATLAMRLDALSNGLTLSALEEANQTRHVGSLAFLVQDFLRLENESLAVQRAQFEATNASLQHAVTTFATIQGDIRKRFDELNRNMTGDHVKLYEGSYISDPADPYYKRPAYHAVLAGERTLAENQVVAHNESGARYESLNGALAASIQAQTTLAQALHAHGEEAGHVAEGVGVLQDKQGWDRFLLYVLILLILAPLVYLFGPEVFQRIRRQRARIPPPSPREDDGLPLEEEIEELRAHARATADADPDDAPAPAPSSAPRRAWRAPSVKGV